MIERLHDELNLASQYADVETTPFGGTRKRAEIIVLGGLACGAIAICGAIVTTAYMAVNYIPRVIESIRR